MTQDVTLWLRAMEAWAVPPASPCLFCSGESGNGTGFSHSTTVSPVSVIQAVLRIHLNTVLVRRTNGRILGSVKPGTGKESTFTFFAVVVIRTLVIGGSEL